jgi:hypothetical protein
MAGSTKKINELPATTSAAGTDVIPVQGPNAGNTTNKITKNNFLAEYQTLAEKGVANGYASLGADGKVPAGQLPESGGGLWENIVNVDTANYNSITISENVSNRKFYRIIATLKTETNAMMAMLLNSIASGYHTRTQRVLGTGWSLTSNDSAAQIWLNPNIGSLHAYLELELAKTPAGFLVTGSINFVDNINGHVKYFINAFSTQTSLASIQIYTNGILFQNVRLIIDGRD